MPCLYPFVTELYLDLQDTATFTPVQFVLCYVYTENFAVFIGIRHCCWANAISVFTMSESNASKADVPSRVPGDTDSGTQSAPRPLPKPAGRRTVCSGCGRPIADRFMLYAVDRHWHVGCLRCSLCQMPLDDAVATCYTRAGLILCRADYLRSVFRCDSMQARQWA